VAGSGPSKGAEADTSCMLVRPISDIITFWPMPISDYKRENCISSKDTGIIENFGRTDNLPVKMPDCDKIRMFRFFFDVPVPLIAD
jgi:hypothetical protein